MYARRFWCFHWFSREIVEDDWGHHREGDSATAWVLCHRPGTMASQLHVAFERLRQVSPPYRGRRRLSIDGERRYDQRTGPRFLAIRVPLMASSLPLNVEEGRLLQSSIS